MHLIMIRDFYLIKIAGEEALKKGMEAKSKEFVEKGAEVYAKV